MPKNGPKKSKNAQKPWTKPQIYILKSSDPLVGYDNAQEDSTTESASDEANSGLLGDEHMEEDTVAAGPD